MNSSEKIEVLPIWTNKISEAQIDEFNINHNSVFRTVYDKAFFIKKFQNNIYGESIVCLAYSEKKCIGSIACWRNDIENNKAYQLSQGAVIEDKRGFGVFSKMTNAVLDLLDHKTLVYGYPNDKSCPGLVKLGWVIENTKKYKLFNRWIDIKEIETIEKNYSSWIIQNMENNPLMFYTKIKNNYYLLKKRKYNIYLIIGKIDKEITTNLRPATFPIFCVYSNKGYLGRGIVIVTKNNINKITVPIHKLDTIL